MNKTLLLCQLFTTLALSQTANWTQKSTGNTPGLRSSASMAYDATRSQMVLFGGFDGKGGVSNDTWTWDGESWSQKSPRTSPVARAGGGMAYDAARGRVVLFGGTTGGVNATNLNDTWVWDGSNWIQELPRTFPPARSSFGLVYDSARGQVVLFGGFGKGNIALNDTWVWDGNTWSQKSPQTSPTLRQNFSMAYDAAHAQIVLFGGIDAASALLNETWVWDGSNWAKRVPASSPPARSASVMTYDLSRGQAVLWGGFSGTLAGYRNDTWLWDGSNWSQQSPQASPSARSGVAMAYDSARKQTVLFGGFNGFSLTYFNDTWVYSGGGSAPAINAVLSASAFGGFFAVAPGSWVEIYGSNLATTTRSWAGNDFNGNNAPTSLDGVQVSIGGQRAFIDYISPTQVNAQLPSGIGLGTQPVIVTSGTASAPLSIIVNSTQPGLLAPAVFQINGNQYAVGLLQDGNYVLPVGAIPGVASRPAKSGETILLFGVGFGSVTPNIAAGQIVTEGNQLSAPLQIKFGGTQAQVSYDGLGPGFVGLYQFNVVVPSIPDNDLVPLTFTLGGVAGAQTLYAAVRQ